jgi:Heterokaryon incompatibility protein (HET)
MRLLMLNDHGSFSSKWFSEETAPPYAILSHTWGAGEDDEVTFKDINNGISNNNKPGIQKLRFCAKQAKHDDLHYFWVDTCCIDKQDPNELTTAINSMFRWYQNASRCYVYLSDVSVRTQDGQFIHVTWESAFRNSRWFRRGWTLQELLAPKIVDFYSRDEVQLGDKSSLSQQISEITGIPIKALQGEALSKFSITERFSWVEQRQTTKAEDKAYCLLGLFQVFLPLIYGEGQSSAMRRLRKEIQELTSTEPEPSGNISQSLSRDFTNQSLNNYRSTKL